MLSTVAGTLAPKHENLNKAAAITDFALFVSALVVALLGMYGHLDLCCTSQYLLGGGGLIGLVMLAHKKIASEPFVVESC